MKVLKKRFKKKYKKLSKIEPKHTLKPIKIKPKLGRWCIYYEGRLPFPTECSNNKSMPMTHLFKDGKKILLNDRRECINCKRNPQWIAWKSGVWNNVIKEIKKGEDLTDMPAPLQGE